MKVPFDIKPFAAPSGRMLYYSDLVLLCDLERNQTIAWSDRDVPFNSGFLSRVYFRGRGDLTDNPSLLRRTCAVMKSDIEKLPLSHGPQQCVIGIPTAGTPFAQTVSNLSEFDRMLHVRPHSEPIMCSRLMRSVLKHHGKDQMWVGEPNLKRHSYVTIENVVSTAASMLECFEKLEEDGYPTREMHHYIFASWELGGSEKLPSLGYKHIHIKYYLLDVIAAFTHLPDGWPLERYDEMNRRITDWRAQHG